jgi:hypothetical protein
MKLSTEDWLVLGLLAAGAYLVYRAYSAVTSPNVVTCILKNAGNIMTGQTLVCGVESAVCTMRTSQPACQCDYLPGP